LGNPIPTSAQSPQKDRCFGGLIRDPTCSGTAGVRGSACCRDRGARFLEHNMTITDREKLATLWAICGFDAELIASAVGIPLPDAQRIVAAVRAGAA
jgi:hypothetical protein